MALPLRRVLITLSIRLGFELDVLERWPMERVREYMVVLLGDKRSTSQLGQRTDPKLLSDEDHEREFELFFDHKFPTK
jgi:hypothetical protein